MGRIQGKVCIVTGAARGIGAAAASLLASEGGRLILTDMHEANLAATADKLKQSGAEIIHVLQDVADEVRWQEIMAIAEKSFGRLDVLVNNAGGSSPKPLVDITIDEWRRTMAVNCDSVFLGIKHSIPLMTTAGGGSIINISSILGKVGWSNVSAYCAAKGAVTLLTKEAALECAESRSGIRINSIHPGFVDTPAITEGLRDAPNGNDLMEGVISRHPIGRLGEPKEIAEAILFLASGASSFMTGSELVVDGGYTSQ